MNGITQMVCQYVIDSTKTFSAVIIGSQARDDFHADKYSDLDIIIVTSEPEHFLHSDEWLKTIADYHISFVENTLFGA